MGSDLKPLLILTFLFLFLLPLFISRVGASSKNEAASAISQAEETVASAYEAVLEAKQAGANVLELLDQLNNASGYLAEAHMLYRSGDFNSAVHFADNSSKIGEEVLNEAEEWKIDAYESWITSLLIRITGSIVGVIVVILGTFTAWRVFKRRYPTQAKR